MQSKAGEHLFIKLRQSFTGQLESKLIAPLLDWSVEAGGIMLTLLLPVFTLLQHGQHVVFNIKKYRPSLQRAWQIALGSIAWYFREIKYTHACFQTERDTTAVQQSSRFPTQQSCQAQTQAALTGI